VVAPGLSPHLNLRLPRDLPAPPFSAVARHVPRPGELLVFLSWLVHSVGDGGDGDGGEHRGGGGGAGDGRSGGDSGGSSRRAEPDPASVRVSASFNIGEGWEGTAPVHLAL